ncbi:MAG: M55 family metallopeptidase [Candidatus Kapabacteria bacterium]|nr:M55 family metallopeptidase [Candidatus Kapabacteria bacterium]
MKIFIAADMEGATGIVHHDQLMPGGAGYAGAQRLLTGDVNAAIMGVLSGAPDATFVVGDGHGTMRNLILEDLHSAAELVIGSAKPWNKPLCQLEGVDSSFDMAFMIGYHSMAGTPGGLLAHTYVGSLVREWRLNGKPVGEVEMNAAILGSIGIPVALVVGNSDLQPEVRAWDPSVAFVSTKRTLGPTAAVCATPSVTSLRISDAAAGTVGRGSSMKHYDVGITRIEVDTYRREQRDKACTEIGVDTVGEFTIVAEAANAADAFRLMWRACTRALDETPSWLS